MSVYLVTTPTEKRLVKSDTKSAAINHVIRPGVTAESVNPDQLVSLLESGIKVETAVVAQDEKIPA